MVCANQASRTRNNVGVTGSDVHSSHLPPKASLNSRSPRFLAWGCSTPNGVALRTAEKRNGGLGVEIVGVKPKQSMGQRVGVDRVRHELRKLILHSHVMRSLNPAVKKPAGFCSAFIVQASHRFGI